MSTLGTFQYQSEADSPLWIADVSWLAMAEKAEQTPRQAHVMDPEDRLSKTNVEGAKETCLLPAKKVFCITRSNMLC